MTDELASVLSRVAAIQQSLAPMSSPGADQADGSAATSGSDAATPSSSAFGAALQQAQAVLGTTASSGNSGGSDAGNILDPSGSTDTLALRAGTDPAALAASTGSAGLLSDASSGSPTDGEAIVADAAKYLGVPYVWGGTDPATGLDCSGLVQRVLADRGVQAPRVAADQSSMGTAVPSLGQAQPGDLVFFGSPAEHVGIYVGNGKMLDAPHRGAQVRVENVWANPSAIRRVTGGANASDLSGVQSDVAQYSALFQASGARYGVDPALLAAIAHTESSGNSSAVSSAGAQGLMQLMPSTAQGLGVDPLIPSQAIDGAARLLSRYEATMPSLSTAIAAYNAGPGAVTAAGGQVPNYPETQAYVASVEAQLTGTSM